MCDKANPNTGAKIKMGKLVEVNKGRCFSFMRTGQVSCAALCLPTRGHIGACTLHDQNFKQISVTSL